MNPSNNIQTSLYTILPNGIRIVPHSFIETLYHQSTTGSVFTQNIENQLLSVYRHGNFAQNFLQAFKSFLGEHPNITEDLKAVMILRALPIFMPHVEKETIHKTLNLLLNEIEWTKLQKPTALKPRALNRAVIILKSHPELFPLVLALLGVGSILHLNTQIIHSQESSLIYDSGLPTIQLKEENLYFAKKIQLFHFLEIIHDASTDDLKACEALIEASFPKESYCCNQSPFKTCFSELGITLKDMINCGKIFLKSDHSGTLNKIGYELLSSCLSYQYDSNAFLTIAAAFPFMLGKASNVAERMRLYLNFFHISHPSYSYPQKLLSDFKNLIRQENVSQQSIKDFWTDFLFQCHHPSDLKRIAYSLDSLFSNVPHSTRQLSNPYTSLHTRLIRQLQSEGLVDQLGIFIGHIQPKTPIANKESLLANLKKPKRRELTLGITNARFREFIADERLKYSKDIEDFLQSQFMKENKKIHYFLSDFDLIQQFTKIMKSSYSKFNYVVELVGSSSRFELASSWMPQHFKSLVQGRPDVHDPLWKVPKPSDYDIYFAIDGIQAGDLAEIHEKIFQFISEKIFEHFNQKYDNLFKKVYHNPTFKRYFQEWIKKTHLKNYLAVPEKNFSILSLYGTHNSKPVDYLFFSKLEHDKRFTFESLNIPIATNIRDFNTLQRPKGCFPHSGLTRIDAKKITTLLPTQAVIDIACKLIRLAKNAKIDGTFFPAALRYQVESGASLIGPRTDELLTCFEESKFDTFSWEMKHYFRSHCRNKPLILKGMLLQMVIALSERGVNPDIIEKVWDPLIWQNISQNQLKSELLDELLFVLIQDIKKHPLLFALFELGAILRLKTEQDVPVCLIEKDGYVEVEWVEMGVHLRKRVILRESFAILYRADPLELDSLRNVAKLLFPEELSFTANFDLFYIRPGVIEEFANRFKMHKHPLIRKIGNKLGNTGSKMPELLSQVANSEDMVIHKIGDKLGDIDSKKPEPLSQVTNSEEQNLKLPDCKFEEDLPSTEHLDPMALKGRVSLLEGLPGKYLPQKLDEWEKKLIDITKVNSLNIIHILPHGNLPNEIQFIPFTFIEGLHYQTMTGKVYAQNIENVLLSVYRQGDFANNFSQAFKLHFRNQPHATEDLKATMILRTLLVFIKYDVESKTILDTLNLLLNEIEWTKFQKPTALNRAVVVLKSHPELFPHVLALLEVGSILQLNTPILSQESSLIYDSGLPTIQLKKNNLYFAIKIQLFHSLEIIHDASTDDLKACEALIEASFPKESYCINQSLFKTRFSELGISFEDMVAWGKKLLKNDGSALLNKIGYELLSTCLSYRYDSHAFLTIAAAFPYMLAAVPNVAERMRIYLNFFHVSHPSYSYPQKLLGNLKNLIRQENISQQSIKNFWTDFLFQCHHPAGLKRIAYLLDSQFSNVLHSTHQLSNPYMNPQTRLIQQLQSNGIVDHLVILIKKIIPNTPIANKEFFLDDLNYPKLRKLKLGFITNRFQRFIEAERVKYPKDVAAFLNLAIMKEKKEIHYSLRDFEIIQEFTRIVSEFYPKANYLVELVGNFSRSSLVSTWMPQHFKSLVGSDFGAQTDPLWRVTTPSDYDIHFTIVGIETTELVKIQRKIFQFVSDRILEYLFQNCNNLVKGVYFKPRVKKCFQEWIMRTHFKKYSFLKQKEFAFLSLHGSDKSRPVNYQFFTKIKHSRFTFESLNIPIATNFRNINALLQPKDCFPYSGITQIEAENATTLAPTQAVIDTACNRIRLNEDAIIDETFFPIALRHLVEFGASFIGPRTDELLTFFVKNEFDIFFRAMKHHCLDHCRNKPLIKQGILLQMLIALSEHGVNPEMIQKIWDPLIEEIPSQNQSKSELLNALLIVLTQDIEKYPLLFALFELGALLRLDTKQDASVFLIQKEGYVEVEWVEMGVHLRKRVMLRESFAILYRADPLELDSLRNVAKLLFPEQLSFTANFDLFYIRPGVIEEFANRFKMHKHPLIRKIGNKLGNTGSKMPKLLSQVANSEDMVIHKIGDKLGDIDSKKPEPLSQVTNSEDMVIHEIGDKLRDIDSKKPEPLSQVTNSEDQNLKLPNCKLEEDLLSTEHLDPMALKGRVSLLEDQPERISSTNVSNDKK